MEPISMIIAAAVALLSGAAAGGAVYGAIYIAYLTLPTVMAWFRARRATLFNHDLVAATLVDLMASGQYRTVQGVFNTRTRLWVEHRTIESDQISWELSQLHHNRRYVVHTL